MPNYRHIPATVFAGCIAATSAFAQGTSSNYETHQSTSGAAVPISQIAAAYPNGGFRSGQEGWVRMSYIVTPDGQAKNPIIIDSSGGAAFEASAREIVPKWRFEPSAAEIANNEIEMRFEIQSGRDAATSNFIRRYRRIVTDLSQDEVEAARKQVDETYQLGGWNLYESTMLWLMLGRVDGVEGHIAEKLENYNRAIGVSDSKSLHDEDRRETYTKIFEMEYALGQYGPALATHARLKALPDSDTDVAGLKDKLDTIAAAIASPDPLVANATLYNPCDCDAGVGLWTTVPVRRTFSFARLTDGIDRFEVRCDVGRIEGVPAEDGLWDLPEQAHACRVFVFGPDGANFDFVEHARSAERADKGNALARL